MSWIVSNTRRFIFIHIPKTAGTSLAEPSADPSRRGALIPYLGPNDVAQPGHVRAVGLYGELASHWNEYFKFTFVRNPWDRLVSLYHYFTQDPEKRASALGREIGRLKDFGDFCRHLDTLSLDPHFDPQVSYLIDYESRCLVDFIGRFEALERDLATILTKLGLPDAALPHYRASSHHDYRAYYDDTTRDIVANRYESDIALLGYGFDTEPKPS